VAGIPHATRIISSPASIPKQDATAAPMDEPQTLIQVYLSVAEDRSDLIGSLRRARWSGHGLPPASDATGTRIAARDGGVVDASEPALDPPRGREVTR
jgi:hypothetical protein